MSDLIRILVGVLIFVGCFTLGTKLGEKRAKIRHEKYLVCLATGQKPIICSFLAAFKGD